MKAKDIFNFDNPKFAKLRNPARAVIGKYQEANRFFDSIQEYVLIEEGMVFLSKAIHEQAHKFPQRFDKFADMLHERHLAAEYPDTPELNVREELKSLDDAFSLIIKIFDNVQEALEEMRAATDNAEFRPMALFVEELMQENSADYTKFLEVWTMYDKLDIQGGTDNLCSFDNWCKHYFED